MANRTDPSVGTVHGTNPQFVISKIIRSKIYSSPYWKESCFGLSAETLVDKAVSLEYIGGTYGGNRKPCQFLCLLLKLLQIGPSRDIVEEYLSQEDFKYLRALAAFYVRLTAIPADVYKLLEPLLENFEKLRIRRVDGGFDLVYMDVFIDNLLRERHYCDVELPVLSKREILECDILTPLPKRISMLQDEFLASVVVDTDIDS